MKQHPEQNDTAAEQFDEAFIKALKLDPAQEERFRKNLAELDQRNEHIKKALRASQHITAEDLAVIINI